MPKALTINKNDQQFAAFPSYEELRKLGIDYISSFSGELWTDHNIHDPGITMLEVLCYALTDLGYRTSLDIGDLLAPDTGLADVENNFFTPEEILSCNPLTITDIRRMLVDIEGVRNAWVVPSTDQEVALYFQDCEQALSLQKPSTTALSNNNCPEQELKLKGLYRVLLDIDPLLSEEEQDCSQSNGSVSDILRVVKHRLYQHRNLCEDFQEIKVLNNEEIAVCADLELAPEASPEAVLLEVYEAIENLISPRLPFYSLKELLERGRSIEQIFQGRPYTPAYSTNSELDKFSHGFVDIETLEERQLPTVLYASDFYRVIMDIDGVRAIKQLSLNNFLGDTAQTNGEEWELPLTLDHRPVFSPDLSQFKFFKGVLRVPSPGTASARERFRKRLADFRKIKYKADALDLSVPYGRYREDLDDYYSIQHEFPTTYGVGEGDLSSESPIERQVQALQLKGYLSFFDQLLANYCSQLGNIRSLFALSKTEDRESSTYFGQLVENIPQLEKLLRFYSDSTEAASDIRLVLANSNDSFGHPVERDLALQQLINQLAAFDSQDIEQRISIKEEEGIFTFSVNDAKGNPLLNSENTYKSETATQQAIQSILFMGILVDNYEKINLPADHCYSFRLLDNPDSYASFLQHIIESPESYLQRRDQFLNHLLARFGEQFTEYVLLMYALNQEEQDLATVVADKERFLTHYPDISRNRGRGFDYTSEQELWDSSTNLSGLENRVSHLMGLANWRRSTLNPFKVELRDQAFYLEIRDHRGHLIFRSATSFTNKEIAEETAVLIQHLLCETTAYRKVDCSGNSVYGFELITKEGKVIGHFPRTFATAALREEHLDCTLAYFCEDLGISAVITQQKNNFGFRLEGRGGELLLINRDPYTDRTAAATAAESIIDRLRSGESKMEKKPNNQQKGYGIRVDDVAIYPELFTDALARNSQFDYLKTYFGGLLPQSAGIAINLISQEEGWYYQLLNTDGGIYLQSSKAYATEAEACTAFRYLLTIPVEEDTYLAFSGSFNGGNFSFKVVNGEEELAQHPLGYVNPKTRNNVLKKVKKFVQDRGLNYKIRQDQPAYYWCADAPDSSFVLQNILAFQSEESALAAWTQLRSLLEDANNYKLYPVEDQWQMVLKREDGLKIAHSNPYNKKKELKKDLKKWVTYWQEQQGKCPLIEERAGKYYFVLTFEDKDALVGCQRFDSYEAADCAFLHFSQIATQKEVYEVFAEEGTCRYGFGIKQEDEWLALHPDYRLDTEQDEYITALQSYVNNHYFPFALRLLSGDWHYEILWENCRGKWDTLLVENGNHPTEVAAQEAANGFLAHYDADTVTIQNTGEEGGYSFVFQRNNTIIAIHPYSYATEEERDKVRIAAASYLDYYQQLSAGEIELFQAVDAQWICGKSPSVCATTEPTNTNDATTDQEQETGAFANYTPTGAGCLLSGFRLQKDEQPLAIHPVCYLTVEERNETKNRLYELARCGELPYTEFCRSGSQLIKKKDNRYHYQWHQTISGDENRLLWQSVESYETEAEARDAFEAAWPKLILLAKSNAAYVYPSEEFPYLSLHQEGKAALYYPYSLDEFELEELKQQLIAFALEYPLLKKDGVFAFQLFDLDTNTISWSGAATYTTANEAWQAFLAFLSVASYEGNYRCQDDQGCNIYEMTLVETLLVSRRTYADELIAFETEAPDNDDEDGDVIPLFPLPVNFSTQLLTIPQQGSFMLSIAEQTANPSETPKVVWNSVTPLNSYAAAQLTIRSYQQLINNRSNFIYTTNPETNTVTAYAFASAATQSFGQSSDTTQDRIYRICPADYHEDYYNINENIQLAVSDFCEKNPPENTDTICPKAWDIGLEDFLIYGTKRSNYYTYLNKLNCQYSFRVVTDKYRLARFPQEMHTPQERESLLDWLYHYSTCRKEVSLQPYLEIDALYTLNGKCYFKLYYQTDNGDIIHWRSYASYQDEEAVGNAVRDKLLMLRLLSFAQQIDCYELLEVPTPAGEAQSYQLALIDDQGEYVLVSTETYTEDTYAAAILERIQHARSYPFYEYQGKFGFQCYSVENTPDFSAESEADHCLGESMNKIAEEIAFASVAGSIDLEVAGEVIWENIHDYDSLADAECAFACFSKLLGDRNNYQGRRLSDCNLFGVEITHPNEVLADHPASYATETGVEKAIDNTLACVNKEGFHLIEHILLRPKQGGSGDYRIRFRYPESIEGDYLCYEYNNAPLNDTSYPDKALAEAEKELLWEALNTWLVNYPPELDEPSQTPAPAISKRRQLAEELLLCIQNEQLSIKLDATAGQYLANALAGVEDEFQYFSQPFISPCLKGGRYFWRIRYCDDDGIWQELVVGDTPFISSSKAEEALRALLLRLDNMLKEEHGEHEEHIFFTTEERRDLFITHLGDEGLFSSDEELNTVVDAFLKWQLKDVFFCFSHSPVEAADALMPTCPDCENTVGLVSDDADDDACSWPELPLPKVGAETDSSFAPGTELYVPGADPYSFWATVVLPYWPQRFQNINFRKFFEDTLRREAPAHVALRICWLDPKQMYHFDRYYRNWLEANSGQGECLLQDAKACLIDMLFSMSTVYPPARLQGGDCASGSNEAGAILLDATQLG